MTPPAPDRPATPAAAPFAPYTPDVQRPPTGEVPDRAPWPLAQRIAFRLACAWLLLVIAPWPLGVVPGLETPGRWWAEALAPGLQWIGAHVLHTAAPAVDHPNGAGDKTVAWVYVFCATVLASLVAAVWSVAARRAPHHRVAHDRLRTYVRWYLGATMFGYGMFKIIKAQFPDPALFRYVEPYGEFSPMSVLWTMMGHSHAYNVFAGLAEAVGGVLLFWRRTTTLGALVLVGALANVVALNFTYDVTVKLYSSQLLLMAGFLALPDARRLWALLVLHRAVPAAALGATATTPLARGARLACKPLAMAALVGGPTWQALEQWRSFQAGGSPHAGIYEVEEFVRNGVVHPPLTTDTVRWRRLVVERRGRVSVQMMSDSLRGFRQQGDDGVPLLTFESRDRPAVRAELSVAADGPLGGVRMAGTFGRDSLRLRLRRIDPGQFPLRRRGFHWVQDDNFQR